MIIGGWGNEDAVASSETFIATPQITKMSPAAGPAAGGTTVRLEGTGFGSIGAAQFGAIPAPNLTLDPVRPDNVATLVTPPHPSGTVNVFLRGLGGWSDPNPAATFTFAGVPMSIGDLSATGLGSTRVRLRFSAPPADEVGGVPANRYMIKQSTQPITEAGFASAPSLCLPEGCEFGPPKVGEAITFTVTGLYPGKTYHYAVMPIGFAGAAGPLSNRVSVTTSDDPRPVADLSAQATSHRSVTLGFSATGFDDSQPPVVGDYVVKQSKSPIDSPAAFDSAMSLCGGICHFEPGSVGTSLSLRVSDLTPRATYYYAVRPVGTTGAPGPSSNVVSVVMPSDPAAPGAVGNLAATPGAQEVTLSFSTPASDGNDGPPVGRFIVEQSTDPQMASATKLCDGACAFQPARVGDAITLRVTGLQPATNYFYTVTAVDEDDNLSPRSDVVGALTGGSAPAARRPAAQTAAPAPQPGAPLAASPSSVPLAGATSAPAPSRTQQSAPPAASAAGPVSPSTRTEKPSIGSAVSDLNGALQQRSPAAASFGPVTAEPSRTGPLGSSRSVLLWAIVAGVPLAVAATGVLYFRRRFRVVQAEA